MNTPRSLYDGRIVARRACFLRKERQDPAFVSRLIFSPWNDLDDPAGAQGSRTDIACAGFLLDSALAGQDNGRALGPQ